MKKILVIFLTACMALSMSACGNGNSGEKNQIENSQTESTQASTEQEFIAIETLDYWLAKVESPDEVLLSIEEIKKQNALMMQYWGKDWKSGYYDINAFPEKVDRAWLQERIEYPNVKNLGLYCKGEKIGHFGQLRYEIVDAMNIAGGKKAASSAGRGLHFFGSCGKKAGGQRRQHLRKRGGVVAAAQHPLGCLANLGGCHQTHSAGQLLGGGDAFDAGAQRFNIGSHGAHLAISFRAFSI